MTAAWQTIKGTAVRVDDEVLADACTEARVVMVSPGMHKFGARFVDALLETGEIKRCWEGFKYRVKRGGA